MHVRVWCANLLVSKVSSPSPSPPHGGLWRCSGRGGGPGCGGGRRERRERDVWSGSAQNVPVGAPVGDPVVGLAVGALVGTGAFSSTPWAMVTPVTAPMIVKLRMSTRSPMTILMVAAPQHSVRQVPNTKRTRLSHASFPSTGPVWSVRLWGRAPRPHVGGAQMALQVWWGRQ